MALLDLFRPEAVAHSVRRLEGEVMIGTRLPWAATGYTLSGSVICAIFFASVAEYSQFETVQGQIVPLQDPAHLAASEMANSGKKTESPHSSLRTSHSDNMVENGAEVFSARSVPQAEFYAPVDVIPYLKVGQNMSVHFQAFPYKKFGAYSGKITSISGIGIADSTTPFVQGKIVNSAYVKVRVSMNFNNLQIYGATVQIQPGMRLSAEMPVRRLSLIRWLLHLDALSGREQ